ncbi:MAG: hypothetical protein QE273_12455 [Verrucomicrobiales bacterium]|jgi:hypothetical protein|nr:hypothetical protein [Verrucomicrobiales bacterium]
MKTTIDIPEALYKRAKIRAVETGQTLKQIVLTSLEKELSPQTAVAEETVSYWAKRKLLPGFKEYWESDGLDGGPDSTRIISEGRDDS